MASIAEINIFQQKWYQDYPFDSSEYSKFVEYTSLAYLIYVCRKIRYNNFTTSFDISHKDTILNWDKAEFIRRIEIAMIQYKTELHLLKNSDKKSIVVFAETMGI